MDHELSLDGESEENLLFLVCRSQFLFFLKVENDFLQQL